MPAKSQLPLLQIPDVDIWTFLFDRDLSFPEDKTIYRDVDTGRALSFHEVQASARSFGSTLASSSSWKKGDVLAIFSPNSIDIPAIIWGTIWAGGTISAANPGYTVDELAFQLSDSGARSLVTQKAYLSTARKAARMAGIAPDNIHLIDDILAQSRDRQIKERPFLIKSNDTAFVAYSSGTTGKPKGVMLSHLNIVSNILQMTSVEGYHLSSRDKMLGFLPFFHIYGLTCLLHMAAYIGWELHVMARFELESFCRTVQNHRISFAYVVPPVVLLLAKHPIVDKYDLSSLRMMSSGAAPLTKDLVAALHRRIGIPVKQGYGLTETSPTTHLQQWSDWDKYIGSVGILLPNLVAKYMDADEQEVPVGQTGELWIKGPNIFKGYHNNADATHAALTDDGFFRTGDVGYQDTHGNFFITDRVKELIKYKGFQVAPAELEGILASHQAINDVCVTSTYDELQATELPVAYIVPARNVPRSERSKSEIQNWLHARVANHKRLRGGIVFVDEIPKTASGKILRRVLKQQQQQQKLVAKL